MIRHLPEHTFFSLRPLIGFLQTSQTRISGADVGAPRTGSGEADEGEAAGAPTEGVRNGSMAHVQVGKGWIKGRRLRRELPRATTPGPLVGASGHQEERLALAVTSSSPLPPPPRPDRDHPMALHRHRTTELAPLCKKNRAG